MFPKERARLLLPSRQQMLAIVDRNDGSGDPSGRITHQESRQCSDVLDGNELTLRRVRRES